jgi:tRNA(Glu) U13 pseudouridine synthase TruD
MDFSEGYNSSHWNIVLRKRIVARALEAHFEIDEETPPPDADWLDEQVKTKFQAMREAWVRLLPKPKADGGMETMDEAAARTMATMEAEHNKRKSNSAKERVRVHR